MNEDIQALQTSLGAETARLRGELVDLNRLGANFGTTISRAFASAIVGGRSFSDVLRALMLSLSSQALSAALKPLASLFTGLLGQVLSSAKGNVVTPFAQGGILRQSTSKVVPGSRISMAGATSELEQRPQACRSRSRTPVPTPNPSRPVPGSAYAAERVQP